MIGLSVLVTQDQRRPQAERWQGRASVRSAGGAAVDMKPVVGPTRALVWTQCLGFIEQTLSGSGELP